MWSVVDGPAGALKSGRRRTYSARRASPVPVGLSAPLPPSLTYSNSRWAIINTYFTATQLELEHSVADLERRASCGRGSVPLLGAGLGTAHSLGWATEDVDGRVFEPTPPVAAAAAAATGPAASCVLGPFASFVLGMHLGAAEDGASSSSPGVAPTVAEVLSATQDELVVECALSCPRVAALGRAVSGTKVETEAQYTRAGQGRAVEMTFVAGLLAAQAQAQAAGGGAQEGEGLGCHQCGRRSSPSTTLYQCLAKVAADDLPRDLASCCGTRYCKNCLMVMYNIKEEGLPTAEGVFTAGTRRTSSPFIGMSSTPSSSPPLLPPPLPPPMPPPLVVWSPRDDSVEPVGSPTGETQQHGGQHLGSPRMRKPRTPGGGWRCPLCRGICCCETCSRARRIRRLELLMAVRRGGATSSSRSRSLGRSPSDETVGAVAGTGMDAHSRIRSSSDAGWARKGRAGNSKAERRRLRGRFASTGAAPGEPPTGPCFEPAAVTREFGHLGHGGTPGVAETMASWHGFRHLAGLVRSREERKRLLLRTEFGSDDLVLQQTLTDLVAKATAKGERPLGCRAGPRATTVLHPPESRPPSSARAPYAHEKVRHGVHVAIARHLYWTCAAVPCSPPLASSTARKRSLPGKAVEHHTEKQARTRR